MDASQYLELKKKGAVSLMKLGKGHFAIGVRKFDQHSGEELEPELGRVTREQVEATRKAYEDGIQSCDLMLADMDTDAAKPTGA